MALKKDIVLNNGVIVNYHRIVSVNNITNQTSIIEVASYLKEEERLKEKQYIEGIIEDPIEIFIETEYYSTTYDKNLNVDNAYEYLKTLDKFKGAENI